jgi:diaminopimelate decarboxylase
VACDQRTVDRWSRPRSIAWAWRIAPGIRPDTHEYVQTGQQDSKFGFNLAGGAARDAALRLGDSPESGWSGYLHIGSQLFDLAPFSAAAVQLLTLYAELQRAGLPLDELNIGGGLGVQYSLDAAAPDIEAHVGRLAATVLETCERLGIEPPVLCDEPGRSIIAAAGVTLYRVESTKRIPRIRNYVGVDGGMTDNPRFALYGARHHCLLANRAGEPAAGRWAVAGKCCESGDMLAVDVELPAPRPGDLLALFTTGAYTYSMASNYNRVARPAVVLAGGGGHGLLCRRETAEDLRRLDEIPAWLQ